MTRRPMLLGLIAIGVMTATAVAAFLGSSSFLGAPAGVPIAFEAIPLPPVADPPAATLATSRLAAFSPTYEQLTTGNTVITTDWQMRLVWWTLFDEPYDASLFDFTQEFVVMMGGGPLTIQTFDISSVEQVTASYDGFLFPGGATDDPFVSVTSTLFLPGVFPKDPPPPVIRISAVAVPAVFLDDVVFHRSVIAAP